MKNTLKALKEDLGITDSVRSSEFRDEPDYIHERYVMVLGTDCAWDKVARAFIKMSHLKLAAPNASPIWLKSPSRETIPADKIVFDPSGKYGDDIINLYEGLGITRKKGDCSMMLEHLEALCTGDAAVFDWLVKWIAYPLQHPGAKMKSTVVMYGKQGTGKNIFWDAILEIYGRYALTISQTQIESEYTDWMSAKLFILANEVLSRRERRHIKGKLKDLITGDKLLVNQKFMSIRQEDNHCNLVFLSNESDPVDTDRDDRRHMAIQADQVFSAQYYKELAASINIPALYDYFMSVDLGDFNEHTKPIENESKKTLLRLNMRSDQLFIDEWLNTDESPFPRQSIPSITLYWAYRCWCAERGEPFPVTETKFGRTLNDFNVRKSDKNSRPMHFPSEKRITMIWITEPKDRVYESDFSGFDQILADLRRLHKI